MYVKERYSSLVAAANSTTLTRATSMGGFICTVTGSLTITGTTGSTAIVTALPVTAGIYYPLPLVLPSTGTTLALSSGAAGTFLL